MKKQIFTGILAMVIVVLMGALPTQAVQPNVMVSGFSIKEGNATVGKDFTLSLNLINIEPSACAQAITTSVQANFPFVMNGLSTLSAGDLCKSSSTTVDFPMKVDPTATGGFYQMTIVNNYETPTLAQFSSSNVINVYVQGSPDVHATLVNSNPLDVYPGDTATISVSLENDGSFEAQSLTASIKADLPLEVNWAKSVNAIGLLDAKQSKTADFTIEVPKDAPAKEYPLNLAVQYLDENMVLQTKDFTLTFDVKKRASFETSDIGSDILYANQNSGTVKLILKNTGTDAARTIKAKILPQYPFSTDGSVRYINSIEPGKTADVQFTINVDKDATPGTYGLDMLVDYNDAQGKSLQDTALVSLTVQTKGFFRIISDYWFLLITIIVVIIIVALRRAQGKKKSERESMTATKR